MKTLFPYQPQLNHSAPTIYLDTALVEFINQFSFTAFYNPYFGNGRVFGKLPKSSCHGAFITDSNPKIIELFDLVKSDAKDPQIPKLCSALGATNGVTDRLIDNWSKRLKNTNISLQTGLIDDNLDPTDLLFVQPPDSYKQDQVTRLLPDLTEANHNWVLVVPSTKGNKERYKRYKVFEVLGNHWLIIYNKGERFKC